MIKTPGISDVKQFWNNRPCNIRHSDLPVGTREYFDEVEAKKFRAEPHIPGFCEFDRWRGRRVLEIGAGIGTMAINFARAGADYTGVELSDVSLDLTRWRFDVYGYSGRFYQGNAEELKTFVPIEEYDLVFTWGVIHHSPRPDRILKQAQAYMRPGTTLKVMVYAANSWKNYMIEAGLDQPEAQYGCPIVKTYTEHELQKMIGPGFTDITISQDHIFPYQIEPYKHGQYIKQPWFDTMPPEMFAVLERHLGWHLMLTARKT
jgi:2-polyprenyl-3-methyl-5-hydroxy-6-metoxy-1,4-benzoquinol methylase